MNNIYIIFILCIFIHVASSSTNGDKNIISHNNEKAHSKRNLIVNFLFSTGFKLAAKSASKGGSKAVSKGGSGMFSRLKSPSGFFSKSSKPFSRSAAKPTLTKSNAIGGTVPKSFMNRMTGKLKTTATNKVQELPKKVAASVAEKGVKKIASSASKKAATAGVSGTAGGATNVGGSAVMSNMNKNTAEKLAGNQLRKETSFFSKSV